MRVKPVLAHFGEAVVEILLHAAIAREIGVDELRGFFRVDAELLRQAEGR